MSSATKIATSIKTIRAMKNWPAVLGWQFFRRRFTTAGQITRQLCFRNGLKAAYRPGKEDWEAVKEVMLDGVYAFALEYLESQDEPLTVLDLGAHIGLFSLRAAQCAPGVEVYAYEPAPQNAAMLELNLRSNPDLSRRIHLRSEAVGGCTRTARFFFDEQSTQASSLFGGEGNDIPVTVRAFAEILDQVPGACALAKIDVEGAEYEIVLDTPAEVWGKVQAIAIEIHRDPKGKMQRSDLVNHIKSMGYALVKEPSGHNSYFFHRNARGPAA